MFVYTKVHVLWIFDKEADLAIIKTRPVYEILAFIAPFIDIQISRHAQTMYVTYFHLCSGSPSMWDGSLQLCSSLMKES